MDRSVAIDPASARSGYGAYEVTPGTGSGQLPLQTAAVPPGGGDALTNHKYLKTRADVVIGSVVVAASIMVAIWMHRLDSTYSCLRAPCPPLRIGYPAVDRLAVVAAGFLVAGLIVAIGSLMRHHLGEGRYRAQKDC